jgi:hypothetical protein
MRLDSGQLRTFSAFTVPVILITVYLFFIRPSQLLCGATTEEIRRSMPGDDLVANPNFVATRAITIRGRPEDIWPWIARMGFDRAGYYGYDLIENIARASDPMDIYRRCATCYRQFHWNVLAIWLQS